MRPQQDEPSRIESGLEMARADLKKWGLRTAAGHR
jgi:hypothetical protein